MRRIGLAILTVTLALTGCAQLPTENTPVEVFPDMKRQPTSGQRCLIRRLSIY